MKDFKTTAIFGGTFNPPHIGHSFMLEGIAKLPEIERILVMPAKAPPHKSGEILSAEHRVKMCRLAFEGVPKTEICLEELSLEGKSYTVKTLKSLKQKGTENPILVIGADSLINFHKWYLYKEILSLAELYVYIRRGCSKESLLSAKENLQKLGAKITLLDFLPPEISSTEIRQHIKKGDYDVKLLDIKVLEYIKSQSLYKDE
ncbi:MAG: nicotinate (nicotinamide) nucleotide adenylyltransferase [Clostridia bacterium]|nr:nicotinate (nicotinamide) nucleotide adenylyltransferase [Clostridia bacterium]